MTLATEVLSVYAQRELLDADYLKEIGQAKRFAECWMAHPEFAERFRQDPVATLAARGLQGSPEEYLALVEGKTPESRLGRRYRAFIREKLELRDRLRHLKIGTTPFARWRERQMQRSRSQFARAVDVGLVHPTLAFELQRGCSVGCWFCGVSAPKLGDRWAYTPENAQLWREVLGIFRGVVGPEIHGFCYWATDPLDNPDYEKFCLDYVECMGHWPQTTTAQPMKYPERLRALLQLSAQHGGFCDRFSILTMGIWNRVHAEFSPEELVHVELIPQNPESRMLKANAGRALGEKADRYAKERESKGISPDLLSSSTIACVTGFLVNMLDRSVRLVTPVPASETWPDGFEVIQQGHFDSPEGLSQMLAEWTSEQAMPSSLPLDRPCRMRPDLRVEAEAEFGFRLVSQYLSQNWAGPRCLAQALEQGEFEPGSLALALDASDEVSPAESLMVLRKLYDFGAIELTR